MLECKCTSFAFTCTRINVGNFRFSIRCAAHHCSSSTSQQGIPGQTHVMCNILSHIYIYWRTINGKINQITTFTEMHSANNLIVPSRLLWVSCLCWTERSLRETKHRGSIDSAALRHASVAYDHPLCAYSNPHTVIILIFQRETPLNMSCVTSSKHILFLHRWVCFQRKWHANAEDELSLNSSSVTHCEWGYRSVDELYFLLTVWTVHVFYLLLSCLSFQGRESLLLLLHGAVK